MGRYAFFSTDYEYKFWFAIQPSEDILEFGGWDSRKEGMHVHKWVAAEDLEYIREKLVACARENQFGLPDFESYDKNLHGTYAMAENVEDFVGSLGDGKVGAYFYLGCIIYHQLLWNAELTARYEL